MSKLLLKVGVAAIVGIGTYFGMNYFISDEATPEVQPEQPTEQPQE